MGEEIAKSVVQKMHAQWSRGISFCKNSFATVYVDFSERKYITGEKLKEACTQLLKVWRVSRQINGILLVGSDYSEGIASDCLLCDIIIPLPLDSQVCQWRQAWEYVLGERWQPVFVKPSACWRRKKKKELTQVRVEGVLSQQVRQMSR